MKFYPYQLLVIVLFSTIFTACDWLNSDTSVTTSDNGRFVSLRFTAGDTNSPNVTKAVFTVSELDGPDSVIVNLDSLPFGTKIDKVIPNFSFYSTYKAIAYRKNDLGQPKDSVILTGKDTLDFNYIYKIKNIPTSQNLKNAKTYRIKVNVHKVDPELYQWRKAVNLLFDFPVTNQKAVYINNTIYYFSNAGAATSLFTSSNGTNWSAQTTVTQLPDNALLNNIIVFKDKMYLIHSDNYIYSSSNGTDWTKQEPNVSTYTFKNLLFEFKDKLWAIIQSKSDSKYRFATSVNGTIWTDLPTVLDDNFPVRGYNAVSFASRTNQPKVLVAGGYDKNGTQLNRVWSSEDGFYWLNFSNENSTYGFRSGSNMIKYEDKLLLFGGLDNGGNMQANLFMQSADEGLSWIKNDSSTMSIRTKFSFVRNDSTLYGYRKYERRYDQAVVVDKDKNIILIGGRDSIPRQFGDVWIGRLNKSVFIRK